MNRHRAPTLFGISAVAILLCAGLACGRPSDATDTERMVEGLWEYTGLTSAAGDDMPLTGLFLFRNGIFVQQAIFDGDPFDQQGAMAHAGPYSATPGSVHLVAEQTISISPDREPPLTFRENTEHDVTVTRSGDDLTLVFGSGTVQEFRRIGPGAGTVHSLEDGAIAFVDGYFLLVHGNSRGSVSGFGTFEKRGDNLELRVIRWAEADHSGAKNQRDVAAKARFDGRALTLPDGRRLAVVP